MGGLPQMTKDEMEKLIRKNLEGRTIKKIRLFPTRLLKHVNININYDSGVTNYQIKETASNSERKEIRDYLLYGKK